MQLRALRGATSIGEDIGEEVIDATAELIRTMMERNGILKEHLVSIIFTATPDIRSEFPAAAARSIGISDIPLLCASELDIEGAIPRVVRVLMHFYSDLDYSSLRHVYLREAKPLRTDLPQ
ncbi:MAG: chorismate mutase [Actinomycetota bacterium]|nr:chorismate mutase [Actinomycetota bacterium]